MSVLRSINKFVTPATFFVLGVALVIPAMVSAQAIPTLTVSLDSSAPLSASVTAGQNNVLFAAIRVVNGTTPTSITRILVVSDSLGASSKVYNIKLYDGGDLIASTFLGSFSGSTGAYDFTWFDLTAPIPVPAGSTKIFNIVANILPQASGTVRLGIAGLNFVLPGGNVNGLPVYGSTMSIAVPSSATFALLSPVRNEYVNRGGPYTVRWSTSGTLPSDASAFLYLVRNNVTLGRISASAVSASLNSYVWDTSAYFLEGSGAAQKPEAGSYQIKAVLQGGGGTIATAWSEQFSLSDQIIRSVSVGVPNGGEQWPQGAVLDIQWGSSNVYEVTIYLLRGSTIVRTIVDLATNPSQYSWAIPADIPDGSDYRVRVVDTSSGVFDDSDSPFKIVSQPHPFIRDGDLIRARGDHRVWIIQGRHRRHITSPKVFTFYGHLGFDRVGETDSSILDLYTESRLVRAAGDQRVYETDASGRKHWLNMSGEQFLAKGYSPSAIFEINASERNFYRTSSDIRP